jgi:hypothetical protein
MVYMNDKYLLQQLFQKSAACRKAQKGYYACKEDLKTSALKQAYYADAKHKEQDLDKILINILTVIPDMASLPVSGS